MRIWVDNDKSIANICFIWEGQHKDNILHGFGREISINHEGAYSHHIGIWKEGKMHGRATFTQGRNLTNAIFKNDQPIWVQENVTEEKALVKDGRRNPDIEAIDFNDFKRPYSWKEN